MRAVGVIAEFNPLHKGHQRLLKWAQNQSKADVIVVALSGNVVQRGEISFVDVETKTNWALKSGADLVILQPIWASLQSTDLFARHGIETLRIAGVDSYAFGSEYGDADFFKEAALIANKYKKELDQYYRSIEDQRLGYAQKMEDAYQHLEQNYFLKKASPFSLSNVLTYPNSQLGLAYEKWNQMANKPFDLYVLKRNNQHHDNDLTTTFASGSDLRKIFQSVNSYDLIKEYPILNWISDYQLKSLTEFGKIDSYNFWPLLKYQIIVSEAKQLKSFYGVDEGIGPRLVRAAYEANSYEEWLNLVHHKRLTYQRIKRMSLSILFQLKRTDMKFNPKQLITPRQVLGFSDKGQKYLKHLNSNLLLTNYRMRSNILPLDWRVDTLLQDWYAYTGRYQRLDHPIRK